MPSKKNFAEQNILLALLVSGLVFLTPFPAWLQVPAFCLALPVIAVLRSLDAKRWRLKEEKRIGAKVPPSEMEMKGMSGFSLLLAPLVGLAGLVYCILFVIVAVLLYVGLKVLFQ